MQHKKFNAFSDVLTNISNLFDELVIEHKKKNSSKKLDVQKELDYILNNFTEWKIEPLLKVTYNQVFSPTQNPFLPKSLLKEDGWDHRMVLYISKTELCKFKETEIRKRTVYRKWLSIKKSTYPNANNGLFAETTFNRDDIICVYLGLINSPLFEKGDNEYLIGYRNCKIGLPRHLITQSQFGLGAHFCNDARFGLKETSGINPTRLKKNNARLDGLNLKCDCDSIGPGNEICFNYNREQF